MSPIVAARQFAAFALVLAMAVSTPVIGWCAMARHSGQTLHPLFDHVHHPNAADEHTAMGHEAPGKALADHAGADWTASQHGSSRPASADRGTSWSASNAFGSAGWMAGIQVLPPSLPRTVAPEIGSRVAIAVSRPPEFWTAPTSPPPGRAS